MSREHAMRLVGEIPLLSGLGQNERNMIVRLAQFRRYKARQVVVREGDDGGTLFVVVGGYLKAVSAGVDGKEVLLSVMSAGEVFGELSVLDGQPRSASVIAIEQCELALIARAALLQLLEAWPKLAIRLLEVLAQRVRSLTRRCEHVSSLDVGGRLAEALVTLAERHGEHHEGAVRIRVRLSQQDLGSMVGATRESVNKLLRSWATQGTLRQESGRVVIADIEALRSMSEH